mmetsp:Transcript_107170/g.190410  ORF Transcript_107170/g.190410 Transcript_107170/m.190410 type:complete len:194 (-) Transcript_107170:250-831(-)|eukprot:CAMPEP_0197623602 /NCGR_PEP_ID=MMETSP1338-20131121/3585_1 /TAXON_ID=43686 ORGANISM="Pelagodinium beii, Strain RCC1491" /NCGR_SAMPLE_ID=MMETSP1338 /ASSEMBLY_ACC=CAM_ASM_000754 /LENGTH=193 /DNA_ID=CAMNT_0043193631 /DNA_START=74 /DNA_END=655 /DNA_ORIENTATION=-
MSSNNDNAIGVADVEAPQFEQNPAQLKRMDTAKLQQVEKNVKFGILKSLLGLVNITCNALAAFLYPENAEACEARSGTIGWQTFFLAQMITGIVLFCLTNVTLLASYTTAKGLKEDNPAQVAQGGSAMMLGGCGMCCGVLFAFSWSIVGIVLYFNTPDTIECHVYKQWWIGLMIAGFILQCLSPAGSRNDNKE